MPACPALPSPEHPPVFRPLGRRAGVTRIARIAGVLALAAAAAGAHAQASVAAPASAAEGGTALDGQPFALRADAGRVRVLMFWRTDCAVCLNKMPELRANAEGWRHKPFDLVLVNMDTQRQDAQAYDRLRREVNGPRGPLISTWFGDLRLPAAWKAAINVGGRAPRLPLMLVIDTQGRVAARHEGRVPPELWDQVAELLP